MTDANAQLAEDVRRLEALCLLARATIFFSRAQADGDIQLGDWAERFGYALGVLGVSANEVTAAINTAWDLFGTEDWKRVFHV